MKYSILARKGEKEDECDVIIMGENLTEFCAALKIYHKAHEKFESKSLIDLKFEANKVSSYYDISLIMPNLLAMKKEIKIGENSIEVNLTSSQKDRFHKINGDLEKMIGLIKWPGEKYLDINELGKILVKESYLSPK